MGGEFPIKGVLAGSLGIRGIRKDFPIFCGARRTQRKTGTKMSAQRRKEAGSDMNERYRQLGTFRVRRTGLKAVSSHRTPKRFARFGSVLRTKGEFPIEGKLGVEFPIRLETRNVGLWLGSSGLGKSVTGSCRYFLIKNKYDVHHIFR